MGVHKKTRAQEFGSKSIPVLSGEPRKGNISDEALIETLAAVYQAKGFSPEEARLRAKAEIKGPLDTSQKERK